MPKIENVENIAARVSFVFSKNGGDWAHVLVQFEDAKTTYGLPAEHPLSRLEMSCQMSPDHSSEIEPTYAWYTRYNVWGTVDEEYANVMSATLRSVRVGLQRLTERFGSPTSYGQYVARVLQLLGVTVAKVDQVYDEGDRTITKIGDLVWAIDYRTREKAQNWEGAQGWKPRR